MHMQSVRLILVLLAGTLLSACGGKPDTTTVASEATAASSEAPVPSAAPIGAELNDALIQENVNVTLSLEGQPAYLEGEDILLFNIKVANNGQTDLVGAGTKPVTLAALLLGPDGPDKAPGLRDFVRTPLPLIAKGAQQTLQVKLPAETLKGQTIQFQLVQEGVAWFDGFGQAPLDLGAYSRCNDEDKRLCDNTGTPVTKQ